MGTADVGGDEIRGGPCGGPLGGGGGVGLDVGGYAVGPCGGPVIDGWFGNGEFTALSGVLRRETGFGGPKSGVSFQFGIFARAAAGATEGELVKFRGGGAMACCWGAWYPPYPPG